MRYRNRKFRNCPALTILEIVIALAIVTIIFAAVLPQFRVILNSWDSRQANTEVLQNGRVLVDHISRNLSKAVRITAVSSPSLPNGYIQFIADVNDSNTYRYDIANNYVEYGPVGSLSGLAGPASSLTFTCYDACDFNTPLSSPVTDANVIRAVKVDATIINSDSPSQNKTFTAWAYLRTDANNGGVVGCWKLDETSGIVATDSSGKGNNGTLFNMTPPGCWVSGQIGNALAFDGNNDYVQVANLSNQLGANYTISWWAKPNQIAVKENILLGTDSTNHDFEYYQNNANLCVRADAGSSDDITVNNVFTVGQWVHICGVGDVNGTRVYINGALAGTTAVKKNTTSNYNLNIGAYPTGTNSFNGTIDDVRLYNRALGTADINTLANILTYRGFSEANAPSDTNTIAVPIPAGTSAGDLLIAAVATDGDTSASMNTPTGWTLINCGSDSGSQVTLGVWRKIAGSSESSTTFSWSAGNPQQAYGWMMRFTGQKNTANPINASNPGQSSGTATPASPAVTTTVNNCMILRLGAFDDSNITVGSPGLLSPLHAPITMNYSSSGGSGSAVPVTIGSWVQGTTHAKEAGISRALVLVAHAYRNGGLTLNSVTYGGQSMTKIAEASQGSGNPRTNVTAFILNEAGINAATTTTFTPSWSNTPSGVTYDSVFLQNVNQTTLTGANAGNITDSNSISASALANSNGDMVIESATSSTTGTYTVTAGWTKDVDLSVTGYDGIDGHKSATGVNETPRVTHSASSVRQSLIGFVVKAAGLTGTVSGGAGYIKQSTTGLSGGTPTFTLGASNEASMFTIAIAPADNGSYDCCGDYLQP